jgi:branched-chain amino acid aminotransferase
MPQPPRTRTAYFNGRLVPETEVVIPYRDRSFNRGDGCFDMTRTFDGRIFRLAEHVERLYRSLRYLRIDIGLEPKEIVAISEEVVQRNEQLRAAAGDWWLAQRVSRGVDAIGDEGWAHTGPQIIVDCTPLPLKTRAPQFRDGIDVVVPSIRRIPPSMLSPRASSPSILLMTSPARIPRRCAGVPSNGATTVMLPSTDTTVMPRP